MGATLTEVSVTGYRVPWHMSEIGECFCPGCCVGLDKTPNQGLEVASRKCIAHDGETLDEDDNCNMCGLYYPQWLIEEVACTTIVEHPRCKIF